jgi:RNA-directed DNA polymerase
MNEVNTAELSERTKRAGTIREQWAWVEPSVWTDRMLTALEEGVKGGKWFSLIDKVYGQANLEAAWKEVAANKGSRGVDHVTIEQFERSLEAELKELGEALSSGRYRPQAIRRVYIPKPGSREKRPLGIPTVRDRVAEAALRHVLEPIFERGFARQSYGFRPGRSAKDALRELDRKMKEGCGYVVDADLRSYFDTIPHGKLMDRIRERVADGRVLDLVEAFLKQGVMEWGEVRASEEGTPQGGVISPLLANIYLNPLDHQIEQKGYVMIRYADDLVILCQTEAEAQQALMELKAWVQAAGLSLHEQKTRIVDMTIAGAGFDFLGYHFERTRQGRLSRWPRSKSMRKFKDTIRSYTHRANGRSLREIVAKVAVVSRGWFEYFRHSNRATFVRVDGWTRQRLRSILRKRKGGRGRARGRDHQRWPDAFFAEHGFFSMLEAHEMACQSVHR